LRDFLGPKIEFKISEPIVEFRESITATSTTTIVVKSPNKHNRLFLTAQPLDEKLVGDIDSGQIPPADNVRELIPILVKDYGWTKQEAARIWCFEGSNCVVDMSHGVQYLAEIKEHVVAAFSWAVKDSALAGEPMHGVRINIMDAVLHADAIHRGGGQIIPTARRGFFAAVLDSQPVLMEPVFLAEILTEQEIAAKIHPLVMRLRGFVVDEHPKEGTPLYIVKAHIPVSESFALSDMLRQATGGRAFPQLLFSHWQQVPGNVFESGTLAGGLVKAVRARKELPATLPTMSDYL